MGAQEKVQFAAGWWPWIHVDRKWYEVLKCNLLCQILCR